MLQNIQALRALAALMVVGHHLGGSIVNSRFSNDIFYIGASGVDIFFVISGFIMVHSISMKPVGPQTFFKKRLIRVAPLYWMITLALGLSALSMPQLFRSVSAEPIDIIKSIAFLPYKNNLGSTTPILHVGWTLNYEMFFYVVFAVTLFMNYSIKFTVLISSTFILLLAILGSFTNFSNPIITFYTNNILIEFIFGMIIGLIHGRIILLKNYISFAIVTLGFAGLLVSNNVLFGLPRFLVWGIPAFLIVIGSLSLEAKGFIAKHGFIQKLGASSYALYLIHPLILAILVRVLAKINSAPMVAFIAIVFLIITIYAALLINRYVEIPLSKILSKKSL